MNDLRTANESERKSVHMGLEILSPHPCNECGTKTLERTKRGE